MSRKIFMVLAAVMVIGLAASSFAAVENVKVGGDITAYGIFRHNLDFQKAYLGLKDSFNFFQTTARVSVSADLTNNVSAMIRLINERDWAQNDDSSLSVLGSSMRTIDLDLGYVKVANLMTPGLDLIVGRQEIQIGEGFVVGSSYNAANYNVNLAAADLGMQKAFDAIRVDYKVAGAPVSLMGFMSKINETLADATTNADNNLFGLSLLWAPEMFSLEPYIVRNIGFRNQPSTLSTGGLRGTLAIPAVKNLAFKGEFARQFGDVVASTATYEGWAAYLGGAYEFPVSMKPYINLTYYYYSKDDTSDTANSTWTPVFPANIADRVGKIAYAALFRGGDGALNPINGTLTGGNGLQTIKLGVGITPLEKLTAGLNWYYLSLGYAGGSVSNKNLGNEIDLCLNYAYTEDLSFGLDFGYFMKGDYIKDSIGANAENAWQTVVSMKLGF